LIYRFKSIEFLFQSKIDLEKGSKNETIKLNDSCSLEKVDLRVSFTKKKGHGKGKSKMRFGKQ